MIYMLIYSYVERKSTPPCEGLGPDSEIDLAVVLHALAVGADLLHHGLGVVSVEKLDDHLEGHEVDGRLGHARGLAGGLLHLVGTVCAVHFDLIGLFHVPLLLSVRRQAGRALDGFAFHLLSLNN